MKGRIRIISIILGLALIGFVVYLFAGQKSSLATLGYPGYVNQEDQDLPEAALAGWELQRNTIEARLAQDPDSIELRLALASYHHSLGDYAHARRVLESIIDDSPTNRTAWTLLGDVALSMEDWHASEQAYLRVQEHSPEKGLYRKLERLYRGGLKEERFDAIERLYQEAIAQHGQTAEFVTRLALWYEDTGRYEEALDHLEIAGQLNPDDEGIQKDLERLRGLIN